MEARFADKCADFLDAFRIPNGGNRDVRSGNLRAVVIDEHANCRDDFIDVVRGFAHPHEHDVLDRAFGVALHAMRTGPPLMNNLIGAQVANEAHLRGFTEATTHRAANLT